MKVRKQKYGSANMVGKNIERLRKEQGIKQKDFISKIQKETETRATDSFAKDINA